MANEENKSDGGLLCCCCLGIPLIIIGACIKVICEDAGMETIVDNETIVNMDCGGNDKIAEVGHILFVAGFLVIFSSCIVLALLLLCIGSCSCFAICCCDDDEFKV